jgi:hypothetical protein
MTALEEGSLEHLPRFRTGLGLREAVFSGRSPLRFFKNRAS